MKDMSSILILLFSFSSFLGLIETGCWQRRLCCKGRNTTCKANDDGIGHLPMHGMASIHHNHFEKLSRRYGMRSDPTPPLPIPHSTQHGSDVRFIYPNVYDSMDNEKIGHLVMPDVLALEDTKTDLLYTKYGLKADEKGQISSVHETPNPSQIKMFKHLLFGRERGPDHPPLDQVHFAEMPKNLLVRYSVLQHHIPLTIATSEDWDDRPEQLMYLEAPEIECYCDEECVKLGDCCSDYTYVCPPQDCLVDEWRQWEPCLPDQGICGIGVQRRERHIRGESLRGGAECPPLIEMRTCWKNCRPYNPEDPTTVALLLDYKYNETRTKKRRKALRLKSTHYYCVEYELGWVNKNCLDPKITAHLHRGNRICTECQPQARHHRKTDRCASDLDDGESGFWKLIGPKSCNGIWTRIRRSDHCRCSTQLPHLHPFLLV